jgi:LmbE family N-acetylglucosaminyl deacetylase
MKTPGLFRRLKEWGARRLLARLHRITHRMPVALRPVTPGRALVVAPHMDDEVIGPGGTLALLKDVGGTVGVVFVSDSSGDPGASSAVRKREAEACATLLGFELLGFLDHPDGKLSLHEPAVAAQLAELLKTWKPDQLFCPFPTDHHRDHQATAAAVALAIKQTGWAGEVWGFELWSTLWPNAVVDITNVVERKRAGIACHASQVKNMSYIDAALGLNRYRGLRVGVAFGEAFYVCPAVTFVELTKELLFRV